MTCRVPVSATGTTGIPASIASRKRPLLKAPTRPSRLRGPLRKHDQRVTAANHGGHLIERGPTGPRPIDEQMPRVAQVPAQHRKGAERRLGENAKLEGNRRDQDREVVDALMVRHEHVRAAGRHETASPGVHPHSRRDENQARPEPRAHPCASRPRRSTAIDASDRAPSTIVLDRNRRDEPEHGPPPVEGRHRPVRPTRRSAARRALPRPSRPRRSRSRRWSCRGRGSQRAGCSA